MSEKALFIQACEKELERLKEEEKFIKEILRDVQKQLGKYKVEALHMSHVSALYDDNDDEKAGEDEANDFIPPNMLDAADIINKNKLDLELKHNTDEEFDESDVSD